MKIKKNFTSIKLLGNHQSREKSGKPRAVLIRWVWVSINFYHGVVHAKSKSPNILMKINAFVWKLQSCPDSRNVRNFSSSKKCARLKFVWEVTQLSWQCLRKQIKVGYWRWEYNYPQREGRSPQDTNWTWLPRGCGSQRIDIVEIFKFDSFSYFFFFFF